MAKYRWSFEKAFEFIQAKKPDVELNKGFIQQLFAIDKLFSTQREAALASNGQLLQLERLRASSWDKSYLLQQQSEEDEKKKKNNRKTYSKLSDFDDDELVLVNSFLNGKLTISSLPGPYLNQPPKKDFDIRFNDTVLQEDVHVFPTSPVEKTSVPIRGAMKGSRDKHRQQAQAKASRSETSLEEKKKGEEKEEDAFQRRRLSSSFSSSLLASSSSMESKHNDLYDLVGLSSSSSSFTRLQQSSAAKGGGVHSSSAKGNGEALTLEELAKGTAASIGPSSSSSKPPQMTRRAAASDGFAALQRSGVVRAAADEDMPLSDLLFHVNSTTDYESYRRSLSNRADSLRNSGGGGGGSSHSTGMTSSNSSSSSRDRVKGAWTETNTPSSTTKPSSSSSSLRTSAPQRSSSPLVRQQSLLSVTSSVSSNDYYDNNSNNRVPKTYRYCESSFFFLSSHHSIYSQEGKSSAAKRY